MNRAKTDRLILLLLGVVILLMVANLGLFVRMNQLQSRVIQALEPFQRPTGLAVGKQAPSFRLTDTEGQTVSLGDFADTRVLLVFSSVASPACQQIYPFLKDFQKMHPDIAILMVSQGSEEENRALVREKGLSFRVLNSEDDVMRKYQVPALPFFYLIDEQGRVTSRGIALSLEQLENLVKTGQ